MTVQFISQHARTAADTARILLSRGEMKPDRTETGTPAWRISVTQIERLSGGSVSRANAGELGFRAIRGEPKWARIVCGEGPAAIVARLISKSPRNIGETS